MLECPRFVVLQTVAPDYRRSVFETLIDELGSEFLLANGRDYFETSVKTRLDFGLHQISVRNRFLFGRRVCLQFGLGYRVWRAEKLVLELNPRILTNWFILLKRLLGRRKTAVWGHAWGRRGKGNGSTLLRDLMCRLAGNVIAYSASEANEFRERLPGARVYCAANALYKADFIFDRGIGEPFRILFIGRIVASKKPMLALIAFSRIAGELPPNYRLTFVGDGPQRELLEQTANELNLSDRVDFLGHIDTPDRLSLLFGEALVSLSPGYVGLSAIQSFSFGTPMIVADDEPHSPEIAAVHSGENSLFFSAGNVQSLADCILEVWTHRLDWVARRPEIAEVCKRDCSAERMARAFLDFFKASIEV